MNLKEWLSPFPDEQGIMTANVQVFSNCTNLIRTMSQVKKCERDPNDVASQPHELTHAPDAMRYFFAGRPIPYRPKVKHSPGVDQHHFNTKQRKTGGFMTW